MFTSNGPSTGASAFRTEVREFLEQTITESMREASRRQVGLYSEPAISRQWHQMLHQKGWITPTWPATFGGIGWGAQQKYVFEQECARLESPTLPAAGLLMCGPILINYGTQQQQERFIPPLRAGEELWCQGYSEPGAGSDLASLSCRATHSGKDYLVSGTKMWTTYAHHADWIFMLVRTRDSERPGDGITFLLVPLDSEGITIRPILSMSGEHEVNQIFFDEVRVPVENRVGEENQGWSIAKRLLEFERSGVYGPRTRRILARTERIARTDGAAWASYPFRRRFAEASIALDALEAAELRLLSEQNAGNSGVSTSILKLAGTEVMQRTTELALWASGTDACYRVIDHEGGVHRNEGAISMARYLNARAATIYGGSSEVQRNILARTALGL